MHVLDQAHTDAYRPDSDPSSAIPDLRAILEAAILNDPRTLQTRIGPSEIGNPCDACLVLKLHQVAEQRRGVPWLTTIGKAVHEWAEGAVLRHMMTTGTSRYLPEGRITVGTVAGVPIDGSTDVLDVETGTVIDYKLTGVTTIRKARSSGPSLTYQRQAHLYGKGWQDAGYTVRSVAIWYLPRNEDDISRGHVWQVPYDRTVAETAIARADMFAAALGAFGLGQVLATTGGHTGGEFSCNRFDQTVPAPGHRQAGDQLAGLIQTPDSAAAGSTTAA